MAQRPVTIAFDVMGSDPGPAEVVRGARRSSRSRRRTSTRCWSVTRALIDAALAETGTTPSASPCTTRPSSSRWTRSRAEALAREADASIAVAARLVAEGEADALVSAGNTGAGVLACARHLKLLPGVRRAALAAVYPTELRRGEKDDPFSLILDVGATVDATAEDLVAFAVMGSAYASSSRKNAAPRWRCSRTAPRPQGPAARGRGARRAACRAPSSTSSATSRASTSRAAPPTSSSATASSATCASRCSRASPRRWCGWPATRTRRSCSGARAWRCSRGGIRALKEITDWEQYGGAPLLGFDRLFIKAHGRSKARAIANAGKVAAKARRRTEPRRKRDPRRASPTSEPLPGPRSIRRPPRARSTAGISTRPTCRPSSTRSGSWCAPRSEGAARSRRCPGAAALLRELRRTATRGSASSPAAPRRCARCSPRSSARRRGVRRVHPQGQPAQHAARPLPGPARAGRLQAAGAAREPACARRSRPRRCSSATTPRPTPSSTRSTPTSIAGRVDEPRAAPGARGRRRLPRRRAARARSRGSRCRRADPVRRIFIHLDRLRRRRASHRYGPRVVPIFNYFQAALVLLADGQLTAPQVRRRWRSRWCRRPATTC